MRALPWGPSGARLCCLSVAGALLCWAKTGHAQPTSGVTSPDTSRQLESIREPTCSLYIDAHVVDASTHEPIAGASVSANGEVLGYTNENGRLHAGPLCAGSVRIEAARGDYPAKGRSIELTNNRSVELELDLSGGETIEITGAAPEPASMRSTAEVSGEALERTRGRSFSDTLAEVPGVSQLRAANGISKPIVRGQFGRRLPILVSGMRHRSQEWGLDHAPEIDPFIADRLQVIRGAAGVRYGPDAIGGAVLVEPPTLLRTPGIEGEVHLIGVLAQGGSMAGRLKFSPENHPAFASQFEASYKRLAAPSTPDYALDNTASMERSVGATLGYRLETSDYLLAYRRYEADMGICSCLRVESSEDFFAQLALDRPVDADFYVADRTIDRPYQSVAHDSLLAKGSWSFEDWTLTATSNFQYDHRQEFDITRTATGPQFNFRLTTEDVELHLAHNPIHISNHLHMNGSLGVVGSAQMHFYDGLPLVPDHKAFGTGAYAIERLVGHDFEVEVGARYDFLDRGASIERRDFLRLVRSGQLEDDACSDIEDDPVVCDSRYHTVSFTAGGLYQLTVPWSVKLNVATASRPPNPDEQYLNGTSPTMPVLGLGKPDLRPETTYSASLTSTYQGERFAGEISAYSNYISDYIYFAPAIGEDGAPIFDVLIRGVFPRFVTRPVDATFYGVDGGFAYDVLPSLELGGQVSAVRAKNRTDDTFLVFVPADRLRGSLTYTRSSADTSDGLHAMVSGTLVARQKRFDPNADFAPPPAGYFLVDAEIGWTTKISDRPLRISAQGSNLLNTRYRDYTSLLRYYADQQGIQLMLRLSLNF